MTEPLDTTSELQHWIDRLRAGDPTARAELLRLASRRLESLTRRMLRDYPRVARWEQTVDVMQNASLRLLRTLDEVSPEDVPNFLRLAALNIRRELLDLAKHYFGPQGLGANHRSLAEPTDDDSRSSGIEAIDQSNDPKRLLAWSALHEAAGQLPDEERQVFDLLWYQGLTQDEAARILGVNVRTIKRRWQSARLNLCESLGGELPT